VEHKIYQHRSQPVAEGTARHMLTSSTRDCSTARKRSRKRGFFTHMLL